MSSARHFHAEGTLTNEQLQQDIKADIATYHEAGLPHRVDEFLDELNAAKNGTWKPNHA